MDCQLSWIVPNRVILIEISGEMDGDTVLEYDQRIVKMLDEGDPEAALIHQILDVRNAIGTPTIKTLTSMAAPRHPRNGWLIAVGIKNPIWRMAGNIASQLTKMRVRHVDTVEEALAFLYYVDSTLPKQSQAKVNA